MVGLGVPWRRCFVEPDGDEASGDEEIRYDDTIERYQPS
jgi:hypothetical protein